MKPFLSKVRVAYSDTDQMGYVHHNNYIKYYETARWEMFQHLGVPYKLVEEKGFMLPVVGLSIKFIKPAFYDDELCIETNLKTTRGARIFFECRLFSPSGELINVAEISVAFISKQTRKACPPPGFVIERLRGTEWRAVWGAGVMKRKEDEQGESILSRGMKGLTPDEFEAVVKNKEALILDTRAPADFCKGFIPQSINIGLSGDFTHWAGALLEDVNQPVLLVTGKGEEEEVVTRLARMGFDNICGYLKGGFSTWLSAGRNIHVIGRITAEQFAREVEIPGDKIIDIRKENEYVTGHIKESYNKPLADINEWIKEINPEEHFYMHCATGYRSMAAASILQARGYRNFTEIADGFKAISATAVPKTNCVCLGELTILL